MIEKLSIKNFKAFSNWQEIKFAPITLIYGPNSSGKSSIIHSIMLLKQSITRPNIQGGLVSNGEYVDLGDFSSMVHGHHLDRPISFKFSYTPLKKQAFSEFGFDVFGKTRRREYELTYKYADRENEEKGFSYLDSMSVNVSNENDNSPLFSTSLSSNLIRTSVLEKAEITALEKKITTATEKEKKDLIDKLESQKKGLSTKKMTASRSFSFSGKEAWEAAQEYLTRKLKSNQKDQDKSKTLDSVNFRSDLNFATPSMAFFERRATPTFAVDAFVQLNFTFGSLAADLKNKFGSITYLGPLRSHPSRFYAPKADQNDSVGKQGENVAKFIYEQPDMESNINKWFKDFEIPYELTAESIGNDVTGPVICLQLKDERTNTKVGPSDVGFGIGQMLPIIVEGLVREDSVICIEQPEIHLHPRLQAHLANFFVETCDTNQWIIETHSESLMLRLQNMISRGLVSPKKIAIVYVEPTQAGGSISQIRLDSDGDFIDPWPEGFFEERLKERKG